MGWARKAPKYIGKHGNGFRYHELNTSAQIDSYGTVKLDTYTSIWSQTAQESRWTKRHTQRKFREGTKRIIAYGLADACEQDDMDWQDQDELYEEWLDEIARQIDVIEEEYYDDFWYETDYDYDV